MALSKQEALSLLKLNTEYTAQELSKAYKQMAKQMHPDLGGSVEKMTELNAAYSMLKKLPTLNNNETISKITKTNLDIETEIVDSFKKAVQSFTGNIRQTNVNNQPKLLSGFETLPAVIPDYSQMLPAIVQSVVPQVQEAGKEITNTYYKTITETIKPLENPKGIKQTVVSLFSDVLGEYRNEVLQMEIIKPLESELSKFSEITNIAESFTTQIKDIAAAQEKMTTGELRSSAKQLKFLQQQLQTDTTITEEERKVINENLQKLIENTDKNSTLGKTAITSIKNTIIDQLDALGLIAGIQSESPLFGILATLGTKFAKDYIKNRQFEKKRQRETVIQLSRATELDKEKLNLLNQEKATQDQESAEVQDQESTPVSNPPISKDSLMLEPPQTLNTFSSENNDSLILDELKKQTVLSQTLTNYMTSPIRGGAEPIDSQPAAERKIEKTAEQKGKGRGLFGGLLGGLGMGLRGLGMGLKGIGAGLGGLVEGILTGIGRGLRVFANPKTIIGLGVTVGALYALGPALSSLSAGFSSFSQLSAEQIAMGLGALAGGMLTFALLGVGPIRNLVAAGAAVAALGGIAFMSIGEGMSKLATGFRDFSTLDGETIGVGLLGLAGGLAALAVLGIPGVNTIVATGAAVGSLAGLAFMAIGQGMSAIGNGIKDFSAGLSDLQQLDPTSLTNVGTALSNLAGPLAATGLAGIITNFVGSDSLSGLSEQLKTFEELNPTSLTNVGIALSNLTGPLAVAGLAGIITNFVGSGSLSGLSEQLKTFEELNPTSLTNVGIALENLAGPLAATGLAGIITNFVGSGSLSGLSEQLKTFEELDGEKLQTVGDGISALANGLTAFAGANLANLGAELLDSVTGFFVDSPLEKIQGFSEVGPGLEKAGLGLQGLNVGLTDFQTLNFDGDAFEEKVDKISSAFSTLESDVLSELNAQELRALDSIANALVAFNSGQALTSSSMENQIMKMQATVGQSGPVTINNVNNNQRSSTANISGKRNAEKNESSLMRAREI